MEPIEATSESETSESSFATPHERSSVWYKAYIEKLSKSKSPISASSIGMEIRDIEEFQDIVTKEIFSGYTSVDHLSTRDCAKWSLRCR